MTDPLIGIELSRYRVVRMLGQGGTGAVYVGLQEAIGSKVAIKVLAARYVNDPDLIERFFAEAHTVNQIRHEAITAVLDLARLPDGRPYIVMELVEGQTLGHICRHSRVPLGGLVELMLEVLGALTAAHARHIVHRDLKPDNIMVTPRGHAKVLDFGIAKLAESAQLARTQTGALLGTPAYMAPEQIADPRTVDPRADIYAAGIVLFEAATGRLPFTGSAFELMRAHAEDPPPPIRMLRPDVPPALEQVIETALAKDPARRFHSAAAMAGALRAVVAQLPPHECVPIAPVASTSSPASPSGAGTPPMMVPSAGPSMVAPSVIAPSMVAPSVIAPSVVAPSVIAPSVIAPSVIAPSVVAPSVVAASAPTPPPPTPMPIPPTPIPTPTPIPSPTPPVTQQHGRAIPIAVVSSIVIGGVVAIGIARRSSGSGSVALDAAGPSGVARRTDATVAVSTDAARKPDPRKSEVPVAGPDDVDSNDPPHDTTLAFDPRSFDPLIFLDAARGAAKRQLGDVYLINIELSPVTRRGIDFGKPHRVHYTFGSTTKKVCMVVEAQPQGGRFETTLSCHGKPVRDPKCTFAQLLARDELAGYLPNAPVDLKYAATSDGAEWAIHARMFGADETNEADDDLCR